MPGQIDAAWTHRFGRKIGLEDAKAEDAPMIEALLKLMQDDGADFTNTFDALSHGAPRDQFLQQEAFDTWFDSWQKRLEGEADPVAVMQATNPRIIPRNHRVEEMISAAVSGDYAPLHRLLTALSAPYTCDDIDLMRPPTQSERVPATFCGT